MELEFDFNISPIDEIVADIRKLRVQKELHDLNATTMSKSRDTLAEEERELTRLFNEQIELVRNRRRILNNEIQQERISAQQVESQIEIKAHELSTLQKNEDYLTRLAHLEQKVLGLLKDEPALASCREYQMADIVFSLDAYLQGLGGVLNANEMSLGKTYETILSLIAASKIHMEKTGQQPNILWMTKKSLVRSSTREIKHWTKYFFPIPVCANTISERNMMIDLFSDSDHKIYVTNYEAIRTTPYFKTVVWDFIVIDEVHKLKGGASYTPSQIWKDTREIAKSATLFMLSGTPMLNRAQEMWAYLHIFDPERFPTFKEFERNFCNMKSIAGELAVSIDVTKLLEGALKGRMIKRTKKEVGVQLPSLEIINVDLEHNEDQASLYKQMRERFFVWLEEQTEEDEGKTLTATAIITQLLRLRQINVSPSGIRITNADGTTTSLEGSSAKIDEVMDRLAQLDEQVVISCNFNEPMFDIQRRCRDLGLRCEVIYGGSKGDYEEEFQQGKIDVLCINMAMGEGLNLHKNPERWPGGSSIMFLLDYWWNPGKIDQMIGRIHRPGAIEPCTVYYLRHPETTDEFLEGIVEEKRLEINSIESSEVLRPPSEWKSYLKGKV